MGQLLEYLTGRLKEDIKGIRKCIKKDKPEHYLSDNPIDAMMRRKESEKKNIEHFKDCINLIKSLKKNPRTRKELLGWYKLFYEMGNDFGNNHSSPVMESGSNGVEIMEEMFGVKKGDLK